MRYTELCSRLRELHIKNQHKSNDKSNSQAIFPQMQSLTLNLFCFDNSFPEYHGGI